jgi:hypothetical protein
LRRFLSSTFHVHGWASILTVLSFTAFSDARADIADLSDEFDDPASLASWTRHETSEDWPSQIRRIDVSESTAGHLTIEPEVSSWFEDFRGAYLYKLVDGDFAVTMRIEATGLDGGVPSSNFSLAGILVRAPRPPAPTFERGRENWLFINTGANERQPRVETKTTVDSLSTLRLIPSRAGPIELRIERRGTTFSLYRQYDGEVRERVETFERPDLPETLQVGIDAYTDWDTVASMYASLPFEFNSTVIASPPGNADLIARVDWIRFERICASGLCVPPAFDRGDANADGSFDVSDPISILIHLFVSGDGIPCEKSADADDSGTVDISDAIVALTTLFLDGEPLSPPFGACAEDPTADELECAVFAVCGA